MLEIRVNQKQLMISTEMQQSVPIVCTLCTDSGPVTQMHFHGGQSTKLRVHITSKDHDVRTFCTVDQSRKIPVQKCPSQPLTQRLYADMAKKHRLRRW